MDTQVHAPRQGYGIIVEPLQGLITARRNGTILAQSTRAKVMYETRLPPAIYFPAEDVQAPLSPHTDLQTFCPFKGTASYRDILLPGDGVQNGVWAYEEAMPEASAIAGHVGFMPGAGAEFDFGANTVEMPDYGNISGPVIDWLLRDAALVQTPEELTSALAEKFVEQGIYLSRLSVMAWSLHPLIAGKNFIWQKKTGEVTTYAPSYEIHDHPAYRNSPLRHVSNGLGGVRHRLGSCCSEDAFPILEDLRKEGATDYVAMPLRFSDGRINVLTLTSNHPNGFSTANLGLIFECSDVIARYYEIFMQRENAQSLLETYVGKRTGARVLGGEIRRGDGDEIDAAIMFCDLRGSTRLEEQLGRQDYISLLNQFFETASTIVHDHGGEVLKFIGDAVLAVFPAGSDPAKARQQALDSARAIVARLEEIAHQPDGHRCEAAIGIAYGRVTYGNVGSRERLDFTVIGQAANIAARLGDYGKTVNYPVVVSRDILSDPSQGVSLGEVSLHNVSRPVTCFAVPSQTEPQAAAE
ncbi:DUF427 domain-containing protein [Leisingera sp. ANG-Vp]|uniref:DUF427 domain-containing protein n=1 Tax=Leisingera sp. ANG-Vp TaxID=1577896 RepID=UPI0006918FF5|nr:DUF427 domain-containing protein [Leisingera sp. ANG-Vp]